MNAKLNLNKDTMLMSTLLVTGLLMAGIAPIVSSEEARATAAAQMVVESARDVAQTAITPTAMRPVQMEPAIIVTAPRLIPATQTAKSRRLTNVAAA